MNNEAPEEKLKSLIEKLFTEDDDSEIDKIASKILQLSPDPEILDYIFHSDEYCDSEGNIKLEKLIKKVMSYKPIIL